jgi:hypothetical protein
LGELFPLDGESGGGYGGDLSDFSSRAIPELMVWSVRLFVLSDIHLELTAFGRAWLVLTALRAAGLLMRNVSLWLESSLFVEGSLASELDERWRSCGCTTCPGDCDRNFSQPSLLLRVLWLGVMVNGNRSVVTDQ